MWEPGETALSKLDQVAELVDDARTQLRMRSLDEALHACLLAQVTLESATDSTVKAMRWAGYTWAEVGDRLGVTRQSAHERYSKLVR